MSDQHPHSRIDATYDLPWAKPDLGEKEREYLLDAFDSSWISGGRYVDRLERQFSEFTGSPHAIAVSSGTAALHVALLASSVGPGDEVVVPALTFAGCAAMVAACGADPVFADVDPENWGLCPNSVAAAITERTRAVLAVHLFGFPCALRELQRLCAEHGIVLVEDVAEALGSRYEGRALGSIGSAGCFSFQAAKTITTGEGGIVITADSGLAARMRLLRNHGFRPGTIYWHDLVGFNYRLTNLQAAIGVAQMERLPGFLEARAHLAQLYEAGLRDVPGVVVPDPVPGASIALWEKPIYLEPAFFVQGSEGVRLELASRGIETRPMFWPVNELPPYEAAGAHVPFSANIARHAISLPVWPGMTDGDVGRVCEAIASLSR